MILNQIGTVSTRAALATFVMTMAMGAPAFSKPVKSEQRPTVATLSHDDRFPWLDRGYVAVAQTAPKREARSRTSRVRTSSRTASAPTHVQGTAGVASFGSSGLVAEARRYIGTNPTGRSRLWCARFLNLVLERSGRQGSGSDMAQSFAAYGSRVSGPQVGAIAVMSRGKRGGHVGVVSGIDANGNPIIISGNHGRSVAESAYPRGRVYAYVMP
jgi:uncharacterized protein (TIGR02594 family)